MCAGHCTAVTAASLDRDRGLAAKPQGMTGGLCDLGQPSRGDRWISFIHPTVSIEASCVPGPCANASKPGLWP